MITVIILGVLALLFVVKAGVEIWKEEDRTARVYKSAMNYRSFLLRLSGAFVFCLGVWLISFIILAPFTGGFLPNYGEGTYEGYITKVEKVGFIWKTYEAEIQVGTGEQAALQQPFCFSIADPDMVKFVTSYSGEKVRIGFTHWMLLDLKKGETFYNCVSILPVNDD